MRKSKEGEPAPRKELKTSLDSLFAIKDEKPLEVANPSPEILAAQIHVYDAFIIGPSNSNIGFTDLESIQLEAQTMGKRKIPLARITVGTPDRDIKQDYIREDPDTAQELKFGTVLSLIAEYDSERTGQLINPLAKELLVDRILYPTQDPNGFVVTTETRSKEDIAGSVHRLRAFGRDLDGDDARLYNDLADKTEAAYTQYGSERDEIVEQTTIEMKKKRIKSTRPKRYATRAGALLTAGVGALALFSTTNSHAISEETAAQANTVVNTVNQLTRTDLQLQNLQTLPILTEPDKHAIQRTQQLTLRYESDNLRTIQLNNPSNDKERAIFDEAQHLRKKTLDAVADNNLTGEEAKLLDNSANQLSLAIQNTSYDTSPALWGIGGGLEATSLSLLLWSRRFGGGKDKKLQMYKEGLLAREDTTPSPAVNSEYGLRAKVIYASKPENST